ncbi:MAG: hypothetical protein R8K21_08235 [Mariprofundales bacterium]
MKDNPEGIINTKIVYAFSVDALSSSASHAWRFCGANWRVIKFAENIQCGDELLNIDQLSIWIGSKMIKDKRYGLRMIEKKNNSANKQRCKNNFFFFTRSIFTHAILHRFDTSPLPSFEDLKQAIAITQVSNIVWLPIVDIDGNFRCLNSGKEAISFNPIIAVRGELCSSTRFIGSRAAKNDNYIQQLYAAFMAGWYEHLCSRKCGIFIPDNKETSPLEITQEKLAQWQPELLP